VLRGGGQISAARWEEWGFSRGFWGEIFRDFFAEWWRKMINGAQRAFSRLRRPSWRDLDFTQARLYRAIRGFR